MNIKSPDITIVDKEQAHIGDLRTLFLTVRKNTFWWADTTAFTILDFDKETEGECIWVALLHNQPVGFISVWLANKFVHHLYVDAVYHRLGIGTKLLDHVIDKIGFPLRLKCIEKNGLAIDFYTKRGFCVKEKGLASNEAFVLIELLQN